MEKEVKRREGLRWACRRRTCRECPIHPRLTLPGREEKIRNLPGAGTLNRPSMRPRGVPILMVLGDGREGIEGRASHSQFPSPPIRC